MQALVLTDQGEEVLGRLRTIVQSAGLSSLEKQQHDVYIALESVEREGDFPDDMTVGMVKLLYANGFIEAEAFGEDDV